MGTVRKRNGYYYVDFYKGKKRIRKKIGPNRRDAEQMLKKMEGMAARELFGLLGEKKDMPLFKDFACRYLEWAKGNKRSWIRDRTAIKSFKPEIGNKTLDAITTWDIEQYKMKRSQSVEKSTVNRDLACLKHMFTMAIQWDLVTENPAKPVRFFKVNNRRIRFLTEDEERRLLSACCPRIKPIIITALHTGMRQGEIFDLEWDQVDFTRRLITVKDSKNRESRKISMNPTVVNLLRCLENINNRPNVFHHHGGEKYKSIYGEWLKAVEKAKIHDFHFHDLRHTFASRLVMAGVDLVTVKELLGHKTIDMTMRYSHLSQDHKRRAVELLDNASVGHHLGTKPVVVKQAEALIG